MSTVKTRPAETLWRVGTGLVLPATVQVNAMVLVGVSGLYRRSSDLSLGH